MGGGVVVAGFSVDVDGVVALFEPVDELLWPDVVVVVADEAVPEDVGGATVVVVGLAGTVAPTLTPSAKADGAPAKLAATTRPIATLRKTRDLIM